MDNNRPRPKFCVDQEVLAFETGVTEPIKTVVLQIEYLDDHHFDNCPDIYTGWVYRTPDCGHDYCYCEDQLRQLPPGEGITWADTAFNPHKVKIPEVENFPSILIPEIDLVQSAGFFKFNCQREVVIDPEGAKHARSQQKILRKFFT